jgi:hypothetical protein
MSTAKILKSITNNVTALSPFSVINHNEWQLFNEEYLCIDDHHNLLQRQQIKALQAQQLRVRRSTTIWASKNQLSTVPLQLHSPFARHS